MPRTPPAIFVAAAADVDTDTAVQALVGQLDGADPDLVLVYGAARHDPAQVRVGLGAAFPRASIAGGSSCVGVMSGAGMNSAGLGVLALRDRAGAFGVGVAPLGADPRGAAAAAIKVAVRNADRAGRVPDMVWVCSAPGDEEAVLEGIESVVGAVPVLGGSSADDTVQGGWWQVHGEGHGHADVVVVALFTRCRLGWSFHSGYSPTGTSAAVTRAEGRVLWELDGRPAADVYDGWTSGGLGEKCRVGGPVLEETTWFPLGREVGALGGVAYHALLHPERVLPGGGLQLFAKTEVGERLTLMSGARDMLLARAGRVARYAKESVDAPEATVLGAMVVFCAGCMLAVSDEMEAVVESLRGALGDIPFLGVFTFGEQGCLLGGENRHGNLMISVLTVHEPELR